MRLFDGDPRAMDRHRIDRGCHLRTHDLGDSAVARARMATIRGLLGRTPCCHPRRVGRREERSRQYAPVSTRGQHDGPLVECDELIRRYPDLYWAHQNKAWILSTSPDASYRDGRRAVAAATRAAELTYWKDGYVLSTLAAAYAEAGDFACAVRWQEQALQRPTSGSNSTTDQDRLALYKAGKPFRMSR
jgi:hypothetical protein